MHAFLTPRKWLEQRWQRQQGQQLCIQGSSRNPVVAAQAATADLPAAAHPALLELAILTYSPLTDERRQQRQQQLLVGHRLLKRRGVPEVPPAAAQQSAVHKQQQQQQQQQPQQRQRLPGHQRQRAAGRLPVDRVPLQPQGQGGTHLQLVCDQGPPVATTTTSSSSSSGVRPQELMKRIRAAGSLRQLAQLHSAHRAELDRLHLAALINRLVHTWQQQLRALRRGSRQRQQAHPAAAGDAPGEQRLKRRQQHHFNLQHDLVEQPLQLDPSQRLGASQLQEQPQEQLQEQPQKQQPGQRPGQLQLQLAECRRSAVALMEQLLADFLPHMPHCQSRQLSSCLWAIARLHKAAAGSSTMQAAAAAALSLLLSQQSSPAAVQSAAEQPYCSIPAPDDTPLLLQQGTAADVANTLWALGRLAQTLDVSALLPPGTLQQLEQMCCKHLQQQRHSSSAGSFLMSCMFGFSHLRQPVPALFAALASTAGFNFVSRLQSQQVVVVVWAAAKLGHYDSALFRRLLWRAVVVRQALQPQGAALLLWAAGKARHEADPAAVTQLLQVLKQPQPQHRGRLQGQHLANALQGLMQLGLLQQHARWVRHGLLRQVMLRLGQLQPVGVATVLRALLELQTAAGAGAATTRPARAARENTGRDASGSSSSTPTAALLQQRQQQEQQQQQQGSGPAPVAQQSAVAAAAAAPGRGGGSGGGASAADQQLALLLREMSRHISLQMPATQPATLHRIMCCLAGLGYYDPRLYTKAAAALAAAAATAGPAAASQQQRQGERPQLLQEQQAASIPSGPYTFSTQQAIHLLCMFAHFRHPSSALWSQLLPQLVAVQHQLQPQQLVLLLSAGRASSAVTAGTVSTHDDMQVMRQLLQLLMAVLQQQQALTLTELVQVAVTGTWLCSVATAAAAAGNQQLLLPSADLLHQADRHLQRLLPRLVSVVSTQPHLLPLQHLPHLLEAAVQSLASSSNSSSSGDGIAGNAGSLADTAAGSSGRLVHSQHWGGVGLRQLQRLADVAVERLGCWGPPALVVLLHCHTQPQLLDALVADAYAEELAARLGRAPASSLVQLLQVLAAARHEATGSYCNAQLVQAAARQLHSRLLLVPAAQLRGVEQSLRVLEQGETPLGRAVARLIASESED